MYILPQRTIKSIYQNISFNNSTDGYNRPSLDVTRPISFTESRNISSPVMIIASSVPLSNVASTEASFSGKYRAAVTKSTPLVLLQVRIFVSPFQYQSQNSHTPLYSYIQIRTFPHLTGHYNPCNYYTRFFIGYQHFPKGLKFLPSTIPVYIRWYAVIYIVATVIIDTIFVHFVCIRCICCVVRRRSLGQAVPDKNKNILQ